MSQPLQQQAELVRAESGQNVPRERVFFPNLDALRFFAFFAVFLAHAFRDPLRKVVGSMSGPHGPTLGVFGDLLFDLGFEGVSFFFVLSGFLITHLLIVEKSKTGGVDLGAFYLRRILRIWPLYYFTLFLAFAVYPAWCAWSGGGTVAYPPIAPYAFFLSNFEHIDRSRQGLYLLHLDVTWSIAVEEQFYMLWPALLRLVPTRRLPLLFSTIVGGSFWFRLATRWDPLIGQYHSLSVASDLAMGGGLAYAVLKLPDVLAAFKRLSRTKILAGYLCGLLMLLFRDYVYLDSTWPGAPRGLQTLLVVGRRLPLAGFYAFVIAEQCFSQQSPFKLERLRAISRLGTYTYGLYLLHPYALIAAEEVGRVMGQQDTLPNRLLWGAGAFPLSIAMAATSYYVLERPFLRLKQRYEIIQTRA